MSMENDRRAHMSDADEKSPEKNPGQKETGRVKRTITKLIVSFRENGHPEGQSLQEALKQAPKGSTLTIGGKTITI